MAQSSAPTDSAKLARAKQLLNILGSADLMVKSIETMLSMQRAANPQVPAAVWDAFLEHARRSVPQLLDSLAPLYATRFSQQDLDELVRFYESPLGQHLTRVQPELVQESMELGRRWGTAIGRQIMDSVRNAGIH